MFKVGDIVIYNGNKVIVDSGDTGCFIWESLYDNLNLFDEYIVDGILTNYYNKHFIRIEIGLIKIWYPEECFYNINDNFSYMSKKYGLK